MDFHEELRDDVATGEIDLTFRLWKRPRARIGGRYLVAGATIEVDSMELVPFSSIIRDEIARCGEFDREALRRRTAHAGPIDQDTLLYRIEFHVV